MTDSWISLEHLGFSVYEAHSTGIIRRISNRRILQRRGHKSQYIKSCMKHDDGTYKNVKIDGLICKTFIGPPLNNSEVIHINGDTLDSNINSLICKTFIGPPLNNSEVIHINGDTLDSNINSLICKTFIGPPLNNSEVIHINGDTLDSNINNLKWGTYEEKVRVDKKEFRSKDYLTTITLVGEEWIY